MRIITIRNRWLRVATMFSIAVVVLNLLTLRYLVVDSLNAVNMTVLEGRKIIIDPGHGGIDRGASGNGIIEKEVNLALGIKLRDVLKNYGVLVMMTREDDVDYYTKGKSGKRNDLLHRVDMINQSEAEIFISLHVDSIKGNTRPGAQVFYGTKWEESKQLAETMQQALKDFPPGNKRQTRQDKDIIVLNAPNIPGILIEAGFLSDSVEAVKLRDSTYQQKMAEAIARALAYHFSQNVGR